MQTWGNVVQTSKPELDNNNDPTWQKETSNTILRYDAMIFPNDIVLKMYYISCDVIIPHILGALVLSGL